LGFTIVIDYFAGIYIEKSQGKRRKFFLTASIFANVGILCLFKYYNFITENLTHLFAGFGVHLPIPLLSILLPIGLSFHTFQAMSYTIEVYRGKQAAERNFGIYALYVMFYPQLVAGPIERPQNMLHQFYEKHDFDYPRVVEGLKRMLWGFFKKIVIADRLALYVNAVYNNPTHHTGITLFVATIFFSFQIYCDFSGYADIAIGAANVMGFNLMENFNLPYFSKNVSEFWRRWHISLSTWFTDYLYISIGGNRVSVPRWYFNIFVVFLISGLWHGANWTYVFWGALNGFYLIFALIIRKKREQFYNSVGLSRLPRFYTFLQIFTTYILICFSWIFFRANSIGSAILIIKKIATLKGPLFMQEDIFYAIIGILILLFSQMAAEYFPQKKFLIRSDNFVTRCCSYAIMVVIILMIGVFDGGQFIYFQF
jgi:D-alanyl-lipoteichoic acid acyltransferase DltB (MBOAT superfamily)